MIPHAQSKSYTFSSQSGIEVTTLPMLAPVGPWQIELAHDRAQDLVVWITRGQGCVMLDGKRHGFGAHHAFFIPAGALWSLELGRQCIGNCLFLPKKEFNTANRAPFFLRISDSQQQAYINFMLERLHCEQREQHENWQQVSASLARVLMVELERATHRPERPARESAAQRLTRAYCDRVSRLYAEGASMADHAAALGVTPTHLTRVCKAETGKTAACLLIERQLHSARSLLTYSDTPIQDIAARLGFNSPAYFTRFISQHTGQSPSRLRKSARTLA